MKLVIVLFLSAVLLYSGTPVHAEILEIPVSEFEGTYEEGSYSRVYQLDLGTSIAAVNGMWIELTATITYGTGHGDGGWIPWDEWFDWTGNFNGEIYEPDPGAWFAACDPIEGQSTQLKQFEGLSNPTWDFLLDGTGEIYLVFHPMESLGIMVEPPSTTVESATLIIDVVYDPISTQPLTWGSIKGLYR